MRRITIKSILMLMIVMLLTGTADAKWWIFGKSKDDVDFSYLYLNDVSLDENDSGITLYKDTLPDGMINVRGKVYTRSSKVGVVQVSIDNKETWNKAKLSDDGTFQYSFRPAERSYKLFVKVIDTTGKTNDIDRTYREITISDKNSMEEARSLLDRLVSAYQQKDPRLFMDLVSEDFAGDSVILDSAIRKDFNAFDNILLRFTISSLASGSKGHIYVSVKYSRSLVSFRDGTTYKDEGTTEFTFKAGDQGLKLFSMKNPLIFGVSDAASVATGTTYIGGNSQILVIDNSGNVQLKPFNEGLDIIEGEDNASGIATPQNLYVSDGRVHHYVDLEFDDPGFSLLPYETVVEEAPSASGPWTEVARLAGDTFVRIDYGAEPKDALVYYRVRLAKDGSMSAPSNVVQWDDRS